MTKTKRRHFTAEQKAALVRNHVVDRVPISEICAENKLQPSVFYDWLRVFYASAERVFATNGPKPRNREKELESRVAALEARLARKDEVIAEVTEEYVRLKKELGET